MTVGRLGFGTANLNGFLWVTGGTSLTASTELVSTDSIVAGPELPIAMSYNCMVNLHDERIIIIGIETQQMYEQSVKTQKTY